MDSPAQVEFQRYVDELFVRSWKRGKMMRDSNGNIAVEKISNELITALQEHIVEAEELLEQLPQFDNFIPDAEYTSKALVRQQLGLSFYRIPFKRSTVTFLMVKTIRMTVAEALYVSHRYKEALASYSELLKLVRIMQDKVWEPKSVEARCMNSIACCYGFLSEIDLALEWCDKALKKAEPNSEEERAIRISRRNMSGSIRNMSGTAAGPSTARSNTAPATGVKCCWSCGKSKRSNPDLNLSRCNECYRLKVPSPAYYCNTECQKEDWCRHKDFHKQRKQGIKMKEKYQPHVDPNLIEAIATKWKDHVRSENSGMDLTQKEVNLLFCQARKTSEEGNPLETKRLYQKAKKLDPTNPWIHFNLASTLVEGANYKEVIKELMEAMRCCELDTRYDEISHEERDHIWALSAATLYRTFQFVQECRLFPKPEWMTDPPRLLAIAEQTVIKAPSCIETWDMLGDLVQKSDLKRALQCYQKAVRLSKNNFERKYYRSKAREVVEQMVANARI